MVDFIMEYGRNLESTRKEFSEKQFLFRKLHNVVAATAARFRAGSETRLNEPSRYDSEERMCIFLFATRKSNKEIPNADLKANNQSRGVFDYRVERCDGP